MQAFDTLNDETKTKKQRREEFNDLVKRADPLKYAYDGPRADAHAMKILGASDAPKFSLDDFIIDPIPEEVYRGSREKGIRARCPVLLGPPRLGKTEFALAHFKNPIRIMGESRAALEALDRIGPNTDGIVIDDMDFTHDHQGNPRTAAFTKALLDIEREAYIDGRFHRRTLPAGLPRFFCSNKCNPPFAPAQDTGDQAAINDRIYIKRVTFKTYDAQLTQDKQDMKLIKLFLDDILAKV